MRTMRGNDATRGIPIVMVTANASGSDVAEAASLGVNGYVLKPFTADALRDRIDAACAAVRATADRQPLPA
jgi:two-component system chemotaxis response regulator CheY